MRYYPSVAQCTRGEDCTVRFVPLTHRRTIRTFSTNAASIHRAVYLAVIAVRVARKEDFFMFGAESTDMAEPVLYEVQPEEAIARITLNRPDKLNALSSAVIDGVESGIHRAENDDAVRVVVVTGAGDEAFSAGYDIESNKRDDPIPTVDESLDAFEAAVGHVHAVWDCHKPVIAAVDGYCLAGGSDLAMACDLVVATESSQFGYPGLRMGGVPPTLIYPFVMHLHQAKELLFSGKAIGAERARDIGMVNHVVPRGELMAAVRREVAEIRKMPGNNVRILKHVVNGIAEGQGLQPTFKYSELFNALGHQTEYGREFYRILGEDGLDAALTFMNEQDKGMDNPNG